MSRSPASQHRLYFLLQRTAHALKVDADTRLKSASGLTTAQVAALNLIAERAPVAQNVIARELNQKESAITAMVKRLEAQGLLTKRRASHDDRAWALEPSPAGLAALNAAKPAFNEINTMIDENTSRTEARQMARVLTGILGAIEQDPRR
ncbi:MAG: MarR family winged helix-turn-helix transcriptional regulator [Candidatus Phaeomarinobacter sp.]